MVGGKAGEGMKYKIISHPTQHGLEYQVNKMILAGYAPIGGISVKHSIGFGDTELYQAMILTEEGKEGEG